MERKSKKRKLNDLEKVIYLPCDICKNNVYDYETCISPHIYCSNDCFEIIYLQYYGKFDNKDYDNIISLQYYGKLDNNEMILDD
jgi:hypothetical protein